MINKSIPITFSTTFSKVRLSREWEFWSQPVDQDRLQLGSMLLFFTVRYHTGGRKSFCLFFTKKINQWNLFIYKLGTLSFLGRRRRHHRKGFVVYVCAFLNVSILIKSLRERLHPGLKMRILTTTMPLWNSSIGLLLIVFRTWLRSSGTMLRLIHLCLHNYSLLQFLSPSYIVSPSFLVSLVFSLHVLIFLFINNVMFSDALNS